MMKTLLLLVFVYSVCSMTSSAGSSTPAIPPPNHCENGICTTYVSQGLKCFLEKKNGNLFQSQEVDLHQVTGTTTLVNTPPSTTTLTQDEAAKIFVRAVCGSFAARVTPCTQFVLFFSPLDLLVLTTPNVLALLFFMLLKQIHKIILL
jgi:hypothetical protein